MIEIVNKNIGKSFLEKIVELFEEDKVYQNYLIEKNILNSIDQVENSIFAREKKFYNAKYYIGITLIGVPLYIIAGILTGGVAAFFMSFGIGIGSSVIMNAILKPGEKMKFLRENKIIIQHLQQKLIINLREKLDKNILKEKIIIYNKQNFDNKIAEIKNKLLEDEYIKRLQKMVTKNFNILLVGCTNAGKSTLINEFLKLEGEERAGESTGGPTDTKDFKPYRGVNNHKKYTLHDTNGITNMGDDSIESKQKNTIVQIEERLKSRDPNKLIHCIWYCFQGSNV